MQWTRPKSVRQIGEIPGRGRIYMEDYVIRFCKTSGRAESWDGKGSSAFGHEPDM